MPTFAEFLAPFDPAEFKSHYHGKKPLHIAGGAKTIGSPLPWQRFNDILNLTSLWNEDTLKVFYQNRLALRDNYCDLNDLAPGAKASADPRKVKALLGFGASLVANQIQRASPEVSAIVQMLQSVAQTDGSFAVRAATAGALGQLDLGKDLRIELMRGLFNR